MEFKSPEVEEAYSKIHPILKHIVEDIALYSWEYFRVKIVITEGMTDEEHDISVGRKTATHREGRAVDVRNSNLSERQQMDLVEHFGTRFYRFAAISSRDGSRRLIVKESDHLHIQIKRGIVWSSYGELSST